MRGFFDEQLELLNTCLLYTSAQKEPSINILAEPFWKVRPFSAFLQCCHLLPLERGPAALFMEG